MVKRLPNPKAPDDKRSITLKGQEVFVLGQSVPSRIVKRIPKPKARGWKSSSQAKACPAGFGKRIPDPKVRDSKRLLTLKE